MNQNEKTDFLHRAFRLRGPDVLSFCNRIFSRKFSSDSWPSEPRGTLALAADGKIQSFFWTKIIANHEVLFFVEDSQYQTLDSFIDTYHFSEQFERLEAPSFCIQIGEPAHSEEDISAEWNGLRFLFRPIPKAKEWSEEMEIKRLKALWPRFQNEGLYGRLVFEAGLETCCDRNKGCYVGQEIVERVLSRGGTAAKRLCCLKTQGILPSRWQETELLDQSGVLTQSFAVDHAHNETYVLAYVTKKARGAQTSLRLADWPETLEILPDCGDKT